MKTTSYEISKQLAETGFKAETGFYLQKISNKEEPKSFNIGLFFDGGFFGRKVNICHWGKINPQSIEHFPDDYESGDEIKSYDLETILEALPQKISGKPDQFLAMLPNHHWETFSYLPDGFEYFSVTENWPEDLDDISVIRQRNESLADCAARLWLKLKEKGLV